VIPHQVDPGVRLLRHAELEVKLTAPMFEERVDIRRAPRVTVDEYPRARTQRQLPGVIGVQADAADDLPGVRGLRRPADQVPAIEEVDPIAHGHSLSHGDMGSTISGNGCARKVLPAELATSEEKPCRDSERRRLDP